jgi:hypothetical protein
MVSPKGLLASRAIEGLYSWVVLLHVVAAFTFALAHGVSAGVALKLRGERETLRAQALLDFSRFAVNTMHVSVLVLLIASVAAGCSSLGCGARAGSGPRGDEAL